MKKIVLSLASAILCSLPAMASTITYSYSAFGLQTYTIAQSGTYQVTAYGASGGDALRSTGGTGAIVGGTFSFTAGQILDIYVGQQGSYSGNAGGGGGGTFVVLDASGSPLIVAGAGGGAPNYLNGTGGTASLTNTGTGGGAGASGAFDGAGGGGFAGSGAGTVRAGGGSGFSTLTGGAGFNGGSGGYGGGGGGGGYGGGGGGGYNGGDGGVFSSTATGGSGGGSYLDLSATNLVQLNGLSGNLGNGQVLITPLTLTAITPEPSSLALLGTGLLSALGLARRRFVRNNTSSSI